MYRGVCHFFYIIGAVVWAKRGNDQCGPHPGWRWVQRLGMWDTAWSLNIVTVWLGRNVNGRHVEWLKSLPLLQQRWRWTRTMNVEDLTSMYFGKPPFSFSFWFSLPFSWFFLLASTNPITSTTTAMGYDHHTHIASTMTTTMTAPSNQHQNGIINNGSNGWLQMGTAAAAAAEAQDRRISSPKYRYVR